MCRNLQVSHLSLGRESLRAQSGFTVYMNQNSRTMCSVLENGGFFPVSSCSPIFCRLSSQLGTVICCEYLNNVDWGRIRGCNALLDVELCFSGGFCVGSWMQNNKNSVQLDATMSVVACLSVKHWVKGLNFYWCRSVKNIENYEGSKMFLLLISHLGRCHLAAGHSKNIFTFLHSFILA